jgi:hypothetical protein
MTHPEWLQPDEHLESYMHAVLDQLGHLEPVVQLIAPEPEPLARRPKKRRRQVL